MLKFRGINRFTKLNMKLMISYLKTKLDHKQKTTKKINGIDFKKTYIAIIKITIYRI